MSYLPRAIDAELEDLLNDVPAVSLDGAKGVGKTETALQRASTALYLDSEEHRTYLAADPGLHNVTASASGTVLIDEWQNTPAVWDAVRRAVDRHAPAGTFIITGSAGPRTGTDTHSGAGRIMSLRMRPMAMFERGRYTAGISLGEMLESSTPEVSGRSSATLPDYATAVAEGGFPGILALPARRQPQALDSYLRQIVDRDLPGIGFTSRHPESLRRWLAAYGAASSTTTAYSRILDATTPGEPAQPTKATTAHYRDLLTQIWVLDPVPAWNSVRNPLKAAQSSPKHQLVDPALALRLQGLSARDLTLPRGAHLLGPLLESLATLSVRVAATAHSAQVGHLRTARGDHEVDLVVEGFDGRLVGIEVKAAAFVEDKDVRHLLWFRDQFPDDVVDLVVLYTGEFAYRRADGIAVVPLAMFGV